MMIGGNSATTMTLNENTKHTDMVVVFGTTRIPCHKEVLCTFSSVIAKAMETPKSEGLPTEFVINTPDVTKDDVMAFILAFYNAWDPPTMDRHGLAMYRMACEYESRKVKEMTVTNLSRILGAIKKSEPPVCNCETELKSTIVLTLTIDEFKAFAETPGVTRLSESIDFGESAWSIECKSGKVYQSHTKSNYRSVALTVRRNGRGIDAKATWRLKTVNGDSSVDGLTDLNMAVKSCKKLFLSDEVMNKKHEFYDDEDTVTIEAAINVERACCVKKYGLLHTSLTCFAMAPPSFWTIATKCPELWDECVAHVTEDKQAGFYFSGDGQYEWAKANYPKIVNHLANIVAGRLQ